MLHYKNVYMLDIFILSHYHCLFVLLSGCHGQYFSFTHFILMLISYLLMLNYLLNLLSHLFVYSIVCFTQLMSSIISGVYEYIDVWIKIDLQCLAVLHYVCALVVQEGSLFKYLNIIIWYDDTLSFWV